MYPLDVTMPQAGCCVAGGLEFGAGIDPRIFFFFFRWKKAYMPIDANHISNSKDR